jgi:hypothetical protein
LKYDYIPLADTIETMITTMEEALGSPWKLNMPLTSTGLSTTCHHFIATGKAA